MDSEVSDGWAKFVECELKVPEIFMENDRMDCFHKIGEERADGFYSERLLGVAQELQSGGYLL